MAGGIPLPRTKFQRVFSATYTDDLVGVLVGVPASLLAAYKLYADGSGWWFIIAAIILFLVGLAKFFLAYRTDSGGDRIHALEGALHTLYRLLVEYSPMSPDPRLRLTLHRPSDDGQWLVQVLEYVGDQRAMNATVGRKTRAVCGIIGRALKEKQFAVGKRHTENPEAYIEELQRLWHYTEAEARKLNSSSMTWLAIPLLDGNNQMLAVLFADSVVADFFDEADDKADLVLMANAAAAGIAEFVSRKLT